ncbi:MAG: alpha/beta hydrolase [Actinomycetota bacterium]|nr:alpha/beta hydrolase [Actinomycetota bacterium]
MACAVAIAIPLAVNALIVGAETERAKADTGFIVRLAHHDDLQAREDGSAAAPALVLLHGFAASLHWWDAVTPELALRYHVIRFDLLGHGGSAKPSSGYSMAAQARLIDEALARLGVHRALLVGHSMGGLVATALAERDPTLVAGIALVDSPPTTGAASLPFLARLAFLPVIGQAVRTLATNGMVASGLQAAFAPGFKVRPEFVHDFWRTSYSSYSESDNDSTQYLRRQPLPSRLTSLALPLLVIYGTRDRLVSPRSEHGYAAVANAQVLALPGAGHSPMVEQPLATSRLILSFAARTLR